MLNYYCTVRNCKLSAATAQCMMHSSPDAARQSLRFLKQHQVQLYFPASTTKPCRVMHPPSAADQRLGPLNHTSISNAPAWQERRQRCFSRCKSMTTAADNIMLPCCAVCNHGCSGARQAAAHAGSEHRYAIQCLNAVAAAVMEGCWLADMPCCILLPGRHTHAQPSTQPLSHCAASTQHSML
jgi:hypothetical protein